MRKIYFTIIALFAALSSMAATTTVVSAGFTFSPAAITITQGDTIQFNIAANHNVIEVTQATWNANGSTSNGGFMLPLGGGQITGLAPGMYYYVCGPHAGSAMKGTIMVMAGGGGGNTDLWINEIHYDNALGDVDEGFEIAGVAGTDLSCYAVMLYNGSDSELYGNNDSIVLTGLIDDEGCGYGAVWFGLPPNGLQNGSPDGIGLYNHCTSQVVQFLSYEGVLTAGDGPMLGLTSEDIGVVESGTQVVGGSLQLTGSGSVYTDFAWDSTGVNSYDVLNPGQNICGPTINVETPTFTMNEGDATTIVTNLIIAPTNTLASSFEIHLVGGTGSAADLDLTTVGGSFPITVPVAAASTTLTVPITPIDDAVYEGTETFDFVIRNATGDILIGVDSTFVLTMTDNELPPDTTVEVTATAISANEGDGTATVSVAISQLSANGNDFTVDLALSSGSAADLDNYATQTLTFTPTGASSQDVTITITDDAMVEGTEVFEFELMNPSAGLDLGPDSITVLTLTDNDVASSSLAAVTTTDAGGNIDSLGVMTVLTGVVNSPDRGFNSTEFSIQDATGSITVYSTDAAITYDAMVGDEVEVQGTIDERFGVTVITDIVSINVLTMGNAIDTTTITVLDETEESTLVRYDNLTLVDAADWTAAGGAGFDVRGLNASNDTIMIRIDRDYDDLYNSAAPFGEFDIVGVLGQFDIDSPYVDNYQIIPRFLTDIIAEPLPIVDATIDEINNVNAAGEADSLGRVYRVTGTVNSPDRGFNSLEFSIQDAGAGVTIFTTDPAYDAFVATVGDAIEVVGTLTQDVGVIRLENIQGLSTLSTGNPVDTNVVTDMNDDNESTLIRLNGLSLVDASQWAAVGGAGFTVQCLDSSGDTVDLRIDRDYDALYNSAAPVGQTFDVVGVTSQFDFTSPFDEGYQIIPRFLTDIIDGPIAINELELSSFSAYPNPVEDLLTITFEYDVNETMIIRLVNVLGQEMSTKEVSVNNGFNHFEVSTNSFADGLYFLEIVTSKGTQVSSVVKN